MSRSAKKSTPKKLQKPAKSLAKKKLHKNIYAPILGILVMLSGFAFMNSQWLTAQAINKLHLQPSNQFIDSGVASAETAQNSTPTVLIPKINVNAPVVVDVESHKESDVQLGLRRGVLHYGQTAFPGQKGNVVLFGHSSGQIWTPGDYKFVFTLLNNLQEKDRIYIDYNGIRYTYLVSDKRVVSPTDFSVIQKTDFAQLTLITCTPVGTSKDRLVVRAKQIMPDPDKATEIQGQPSQLKPGSLPQ